MIGPIEIIVLLPGADEQDDGDGDWTNTDHCSFTWSR